MGIEKDILDSREERINIIKKEIDNYQVVSLKANIPGINKNISTSYFLINYFDSFISEYKPIKKDFYESFDGPYYLYFFSYDLGPLKNKMVEIEETVLGRFVDIDCYYKSDKSVSRNVLRKCYLCSNDAFYCIRNKTHSLEEIMNFITDKIEDETIKELKKIIKESALAELDLEPKFGLVSKSTNGSHKDMNYKMMKDSIEAIIPYFIKMYKEGFNNSDIKEAFNRSRKIGLDAEKEMFKVTNGVNTYKGLIFDLGIVITAVGYKIKNYKNESSIFDLIRIMMEGISKEIDSKDTFGKKAYLEYKIGGARLEAESGFKVVEDGLNKGFDLNNNNGLYELLRYLIVESSDTVLLKRAKTINKYKEVKEMFKKAKLDTDSILELTNYSIENNLSFGGAADLLVVSIFINKIKSIYKI